VLGSADLSRVGAGVRAAIIASADHAYASRECDHGIEAASALATMVEQLPFAYMARALWPYWNIWNPRRIDSQDHI